MRHTFVTWLVPAFVQPTFTPFALFVFAN